MASVLAAAVGEELKKLLAIRSVSGREMEILAYLEERCRGMGFSTRRQQVAGLRYNLLANPLPAPDLIIAAHVDTVPEVINGVRCRHEVTGERIYGRGAVDVKGGIAALLTAMEKTGPRQDTGVTIAFTVDEEEEGRGSERLATLGGRQAVVIEPTELRLCTAQSGSVLLHLRVFGRAAHGGEFESGENAIFKAFKLLKKIDNLEILQECHPLTGPGGYNLQMIRAGSEAMVVPGCCEMYLDFRVHPGREAAEIQSAVERVIKESGAAEGIWLDVCNSCEVEETEPVVALVQRCYREALGEEARLGGIRSWTDAGNLYSAGIKPVVFGPGKLSICHTGEEYIELEELVKAAKVFEQLLATGGK